jgi:hypothetical protein
MLLREVGGLGIDRQELTLYAAATAPQMAELPGQLSRIAGHLQDGTLDVGTSGLNISMIKNLLKSTVEQFIQVIVSTALILGGVILMAADFGPATRPRAQTLHVLRRMGAVGRQRHRRVGSGTGVAAAHGVGQFGLGAHPPRRKSASAGSETFGCRPY